MNRLDRSTLAAVLLVLAHFAWVGAHHESALSGPDACGYFGQARQLALYAHSYHEAASPLEFVGPHWLDAGDGRYYSKYPPGYPLLLAAPYALFGPAASLSVDPVLASATLLGFFLLVRLWLGSGWALVATALMAANPLVNEHALPGFAHTAVAFLLVWGLYALARWARSGAVGWLVLAGACAGTIPSARYAEVLYAGAFALFVVLHRRRGGRSWSAGVAGAWPGAVAAALPMALLALRNQLAFGAFWRTGYAISGEQTGFGLEYFGAHWASFIESLGGGGVGMLFALGAVGMAVLAAHPGTRSRGLLLVALTVPTTLLYMAYYWGGDHMSQRFLLPTYYVYALAATWLLRLLAQHLGRAGLAGAATVLALALPWGLSRSAARLAVRQARDSVLVAMADSLKQHLPAGAILLADRTLGQHLHVMSPWRIGHAEALLSPGDGSAGAPRLAKYRDLPAPERAAAIRADLRAWAGPGGRAFVLLPAGRARDLPAGLDLDWQIRARIELPAPAGLQGVRGRAGARGLLGGRFPGAGSPPPGGADRGPPGAGPPPGAMGRPVGGPMGEVPSGPVLVIELLL